MATPLKTSKFKSLSFLFLLGPGVVESASEFEEKLQKFFKAEKLKVTAESSNPAFGKLFQIEKESE